MIYQTTLILFLSWISKLAKGKHAVSFSKIVFSPKRSLTLDKYLVLSVILVFLGSRLFIPTDNRDFHQLNTQKVKNSPFNGRIPNIIDTK